MSGWIKIEKDIESDPRVLRIAKQLDRSFIMFKADDDPDPCNALAFHAVTLVCGALTRLWIYADSHAREDDTLDMGVSEINDWLGLPGFCEMLPADWLRPIDDNTVELPGYQSHNGTEAKKRALTQKRVTHHRYRTKRDSVTPSNASALPDQTRPDHIETPKAKGARKPKRVTGIPETFALTPSLESYVSKTIPDADPKAMFEKFCDQARAKAWEYADWDKALQTYCRNAAKDSGHFAAGQYPRKANGHPQWNRVT